MIFYGFQSVNSEYFSQYPGWEKPDKLQFSEFNTISGKECAQRFAKVPHLLKMLHTANICTVDKKNGGACHGDSGTFK